MATVPVHWLNSRKIGKSRLIKQHILANDELS